ncbi:RNA polymerase sigma factor [Brevibacillus daliensis]|uniref:RNA polymerase sigma factor n=1 Tax=Brevibacillus daliensis TaxID=2892995 RepID=UPI001E4FC932|nr:RNA polymerase sigma factor [Brevibacillus daliensis]
MNENTVNRSIEGIFNKHSSLVYRTAYFLTKSKSMADDITQETFIRMIKKFHLYDPTKPIEPWIYRITINITRNMIRKQKLLNLVGFTSNFSEEEVETKILKNERKDELWSVINLLPHKSKEVIILHFYSELTLEEVANSLEIPLGTCKSRLNYALTKLRKSISEKDFFQIEQKLKEDV